MSETEKSEGEARKGTLKGGLDPQEMAQRSAAARRRKRDEREETAQENALTVRQKVGVALSKLTQREWDAIVKKASVQQQVALMNQAFGTPTQAEDDAPADQELASFTREERAVLRAALEQAESTPPGPPGDAGEDDELQADPPTPAALEPLPRESPGDTSV